MTIKLDMTLTDDETILTLDNKQGEIIITETLPKKNHNMPYFYFLIGKC